MLKMTSRRELLRGLGAVGVGALGLTEGWAQPGRPTQPLKVGFVYPTLINSAGWTYQHDQGRLIMERSLGDAAVQTTHLDNIAEGAAAENALRDLARQGHQLIFATSPGYVEATLKVAREFPGVAFEQVGGPFKPGPNVSSYNARLYEGRFVAGVLAGQMSKSGRVGYVASLPLPEVIQGINAFTLGFRLSQPQGQVLVRWTNATMDATKERAAAQALLDQGVDILTFHAGTTAMAELAEAKGVRFISYHSDMRHIAPSMQLGGVMHHWGNYYTEQAKAVQAGRWKSQAFFGGIRAGAVRMLPLSPAVPPEVQRVVKERERFIAAGSLHPFAGRILDQDGKVRQASGTMKDVDLLKMDYWVQGVQGSLPR